MTYAIGDIHGESTLLDDVLERIRREAQTADALVFLGDYIDRGRDSRGVIDRVIDLRETWPGPVITLMGNHEQALRDCLTKKSPSRWQGFLASMQAIPTLQSYGAEDLGQVRFEAHFPTSHRRFLMEDLQLWHEDEHGIYVHAGLPPGKHPAKCEEDELLWTTRTDYCLDKPVVFGHQVQPHGKPLLLPLCIGIDTGAGFGGPLTAIRASRPQGVQVLSVGNEVHPAACYPPTPDATGASAEGGLDAGASMNRWRIMRDRARL